MLCDQMTILISQYSIICNNKTLPNCEKLPKLVQNFAKYPFKLHKVFLKFTPNRRNFGKNASKALFHELLLCQMCCRGDNKKVLEH